MLASVGIRESCRGTCMTAIAKILIEVVIVKHLFDSFDAFFANAFVCRSNCAFTRMLVLTLALTVLHQT